MRKKELANIEQTLNERKIFLVNKLKQNRNEYIQSQENSVVGDLADEATDLIEKDIIYGLSLSEKEELEAIENALKKISEGTYGICESCGEEIPIERLKVKPFAKYCIKCREKFDKQNHHHI